MDDLILKKSKDEDTTNPVEQKNKIPSYINSVNCASMHNGNKVRNSTEATKTINELWRVTKKSKELWLKRLHFSAMVKKIAF